VTREDAKRGSTAGASAIALVMMASSTAWAQQRPLVTEDPRTIGGGQVLVELGVDWARDIAFPISGLRGELLTAPSIGISVGVGPIAEIQIDGSPYRRLRIQERTVAPLSALVALDARETDDVDDVVIATKLRLVNEGRGRPAVGLRFATRLPNATNESGLGHDTTDFFASFLIGKSVSAVRIVANAGVAIVGDPVAAARQHDLLTVGMSLAWALPKGFELVTEYNGRLNVADSTPAAGAESRGVARGGVRFTRGPVRVDAAALFGATTTDLDLGVTAGLTWTFTAFRIQ
jgi:hypothetical protein